MKQVPYGESRFDVLFINRQNVREAANATAYLPIFVIPGKDAPKAVGISKNVGEVVVGMGWLMEHEPLLAQSVAFDGGEDVEDWYAEQIMRKL